MKQSEEKRNGLVPLKVWLISEGSAGHISQSKGLVDALARYVPLMYDFIEVKMTLRGILRPPLRWYMKTGRHLDESLMRKCYKYGEIPGDAPDLVVSSGGKSVPFSVFVARKYQAKFIFCGLPNSYPLNWFDVILSPIQVSGHPFVITTELLLTQVTPKTVEQAALSLKQSLKLSGTEKIGTVLIGGRSRSNLFQSSDWISLAEGLNELSMKHRWKWLITTSRRTGIEAENILKNRLNPESIIDSVWWNEEPRKVLHAYLGSCDAAFVTQDSLTMISESVCSGKPTVTLKPKKVLKSKFLDPVILRQIKENRLISVNCDQLGSVDERIKHIRTLNEPLVDRYAKEVLNFLGLYKS